MKGVGNRGEPTMGDWETQNLQGGGDWPTAGSGRVETEDLWDSRSRLRSV